MEKYKRTENQQKINDSLKLVYDKLVEYKRKINSEIVVRKNGKIVHIKP
jgi:hypothetical protein